MAPRSRSLDCQRLRDLAIVWPRSAGDAPRRGSVPIAEPRERLDRVGMEASMNRRAFLTAASTAVTAGRC
jgi:hypothetical protein